MTHLVEFPIEGGDSIFVEVEESTSQQVDDRIGIGDDVVEKAKQSFEQAIAKIEPVANAIINKVRNLNQPADEVEVKFGLKMSAELGAVIASGKTELNIALAIAILCHKSTSFAAFLDYFYNQTLNCSLLIYLHSFPYYS